MRRRGLPTVALLTDFGTQDVFVGVIKGVIARLAPGAQVIDLTHAVPPGDVRDGALRLWQALPFLPPKTVILAVVDPGVGTARKAVVVSFSGSRIVCPDNGLVTYLLARLDVQTEGRAESIPAGVQAFEIAPPNDDDRAASATFHGRDIFAPAAARLLAGAEPGDLGPAVDTLVRLPLPRLALSEPPLSVRGEVLATDRFGNLVTSVGILSRRGSTLIMEPWLPGCRTVSMPLDGLRVDVGGSRDIPLVGTFADVPGGTLLAYVGSDGLLEVGANRARAVDLVGVTVGAEVILHSPA